MVGLRIACDFSRDRALGRKRKWNGMFNIKDGGVFNNKYQKKKRDHTLKVIG